MNETKRRLLKGCGCGCGAMLLVVALLLAGMTWSTFRGYGRAMASREALEKLYGTQASFTPPADGTVPLDRMRRFLSVRRKLQPLCEEASAHQQAFQSMDAHRDAERPSPLKLMRDVLGAARSTLSMGRDYGAYINTRNEALLENEMGLGEYTWIYVVAYYSWLGGRPVSIIEGANRPRIFQDRVFGEIRSMIERHVAELEAALDDPDIGDPAKAQEILDVWRAELNPLQADNERVPFAEGLPSELEASLEPFRESLDELACPAAGELEVTITEKSAFAYDHR